MEKVSRSTPTAVQEETNRTPENPHVPSAKLSGAENIYKIKLRQSGYRLVYQVENDIIVVTVLAVGKRERSEVYTKALQRLDD